MIWQLEQEYFVNTMLLQRLVDYLGMIGFMEPPTGSNPQGPVGFRFDGGAGLLMPMRYLHGTAIVNKEKEAQDD